ncbi:MAG: non-homologous end-joining DNA ligase [Actinomycetota bacterium]|nr:non-homologous end-joining DNA ligase [Actinomycetota bacterium]
MTASRTAVTVGGRTLSLSNLDKVFYPATGMTKAEVIDYYVRIAPILLPHLEDRPMTLKRYPDGVDAQFFYEKNCPSHRPKWVRVVRVPSERSGTIGFCVIDDLPTLVWTANLASVELHPYLHRARDPSRPTMVVFDLDPGPPAGLIECGRVALRLRDVLARLDLETVVKTSGSKGLQVYLPLNTTITYDQTTPFARVLAQLLERDDPAGVVSNMRKDLRRGKVLVDWSQNSEHKTTVGVYSLRARERPTVSTPLIWEEVEAMVASEKPDLLAFEVRDVLRRADEHGDLFAPAVELRQGLPEVRS